MSSTSPLVPGTSVPIPGPAEPDPFSPSELAVWRGMLRVYETVVREVDRRLRAAHGFGFDAYGVLITLVTAPDGRLTLGELAERRNLSPSGVSRAVDRLAGDGLVERAPNPADLRSFLVGLTGEGHARLRASQVTHHAAVRELLFANLDERRLKRFAELWETAVPGSVSSRSWPIAR